MDVSSRTLVQEYMIPSGKYINTFFAFINSSRMFNPSKNLQFTKNMVLGNSRYGGLILSSGKHGIMWTTYAETDLY